MMEGLVSVPEVIQLPTGAKYNVVPVSNGQLLVMPIQNDPPDLLSYQSHQSAASTHIAQASTHVSPELTTSTLAVPQPLTVPSVEQLYQPSLSHMTTVTGTVPSEGLGREATGGSLGMGSVDDSLADLKPEDSEGEEDMPPRPALTPEQEKLEYMAALNLVPPAVLEEIHRRQRLCRAEYGKWCDRLHSTDFCLVPKSESTLQSLQVMVEAELAEPVSHHDIQQVAAGPDAGALVEQITYLTSWPQNTNNETVNTVEVVTQQPSVDDQASLLEQQRASDLQAATAHYLSLLTDRHHLPATVDVEATFQPSLQ